VKKIAVLLAMAMLCCVTSPASAKKLSAKGGYAQGDVWREFGELLDLWRDGKYEELYRRTVATGKHSRESFIGRLASSDSRPACCWEKMQEVAISENRSDSVIVRAKVGMERRDGSVQFQTRKFALEKEGGIWKISMTDILSLTGNAKKKTRVH